MNLIKNTIKFLQVTTLLYIPIIILYWLLLQVSLPMFANLQATLGILSLPFIEFTRVFFDLKFKMDNGEADFTPLITAVLMFGLFFIYQALESFIEQAQLREENKKKQKALYQQEMKIKNEKLKELQELSRYKVMYLSTRIKNEESAISYLAQDDDDESANKKIKEFLSDLYTCAKNFNGKIYNKDKEQNICGFVFYNIEDALDYLLYLNNRVFDFNSELIKFGSKLVYNGVFNSYISEELIENDIEAIKKLLDLCAKNDVVVTKIFKNKYTALKESSNISFSTRGAYRVGKKELEIFDMTVRRV